MSGGDVGSNERRYRHPGVARLRRGKDREKRELLALGQPSPRDRNRGKDGKLHFQGRALTRGDVDSTRFECRSLQSGERRTELFVGSAVHTPANAPKKGMKCECHDPVFRRSCLVIAVQELDIHVLIEGSRKAVTGRGQYAPSPTT